ncbi:MAG TPA: Hsp20/alpha crystallin family protein [Nitrospirae bacterium]|nr:Hsp20/alpha crystallin family protein [Nitrospirota bacterium]
MRGTYLDRFLDPWSEFERMSRLLSRVASNPGKEFPPVNVWVNGDNAVITTEIPGVESDAIDISVSGNTVMLRGSRPAGDIKEGESCHRHELRHGNFSKTIELPFNIDTDKVQAVYKKGILNISLQRIETEKPKKIEIKSK